MIQKQYCAIMPESKRIPRNSLPVFFLTSPALALRELSNRILGMVFKGGTSLTKCYQILDRFSEDIDISYSASDGVPGESRKRQLKKALLIQSSSLLQFPTTERMVDNYIHRFLKLTDQENLAEGFNLMPFSITTYNTDH